MMKQKLLIFHPYLATYRIDLYNRLATDFDVRVLLTGAQWELNTLGFDLKKVNENAKFEYAYYQSSLYVGRHPLSSIFFKTIKEFKPDIIIAHEYGINTLAAILYKNKFQYRLFVTCDDNVQMAQEYSWKRRVLRNVVLCHIDGIITVSTSTQLFLRQLYSKQNCKFLYFPIIQDDVILQNKIVNTSEIANEYLKLYNIKNKHILLYVGRLEPVKCIDTIIQAFSQCHRNNCVLVIVGNGSLEKKIISQVQELHLEKDVIFTGALYGENLYAWYNIADTFILASSREAFGAVVNEALVGGCRCIVSDHCGAFTLITPKNGVTFESENIKQLQKCINEEIANGKKNQILSFMPHSFEDLYNQLKSCITI